MVGLHQLLTLFTVIKYGWGAYYYIGCYTDNADNPDLGGSKTVLSTPTVSACTQQCQASGFPFAGIQRGNTCFCDMAYGTYGMEDGACNYTCSVTDACGGPSENSIYYSVAIDVISVGERTAYFASNPMAFINARQECVKLNGDLASMHTTSAANSTGSAVTGNVDRVYIGLARSMTSSGTSTDYEWTYLGAATPYARSTFANNWVDGEQWQNDCVVLMVKTGKWMSVDCSTPYPFLCIAMPQAADDGQTTDSASNDSDGLDQNNLLALYIVLPIMLTCFISSCIAYGVYRLYKMCRKKKEDDKLLLTDLENHNVPPPSHKVPPQRPFSGKVAPSLTDHHVRQPPAYPMVAMGPGAGTPYAGPPYQPPPGGAAPPSHNPFVTRPISVRPRPEPATVAEPSQPQPLSYGAGAPPTGPAATASPLVPPASHERPPTASALSPRPMTSHERSPSPRPNSSLNDAKKQELLENAEKEARERSARQRADPNDPGPGAIPKTTTPRLPAAAAAPPLQPPPPSSSAGDMPIRPPKKQPKRIIIA